MLCCAVVPGRNLFFTWLRFLRTLFGAILLRFAGAFSADGLFALWGKVFFVRCTLGALPP